MMSEYDIALARQAIESIQEKLLLYLYESYETEAEAHTTYYYLENIVNTIIKKESIKIKWGPLGSPLWHATIFGYLGEWIEAEHKMSFLLADQLDQYLDK